MTFGQFFNHSIFRYLFAFLTLGAALIIVNYKLSSLDTGPFASFQGWNSDHPSHAFSWQLFKKKGFRIFDTPIRELCTNRDEKLISRYRSEQNLLDINTDDFCEIEGQVFFINWNTYPRFYPVGINLLFAPASEFHQMGSITFRDMNRINVLIGVALTFLLLFVGWTWILKDLDIKESFDLYLALWLVFCGCFFWALQGVYDPISVFFILASFIQLKKREFSLAFFWYSIALFLHYRALWYFPIGFISIFEILKSKEPSKQTYVLGIFSILFGALTIWTLFLALPWMSQMPINNRFHFSMITMPQMASILPALLIPIFIFGTIKNWTGIAFTLGTFIFVLVTKEVRMWHALFHLPLLMLGLFVKSPQQRAVIFGALVIWISVLGMKVYAVNVLDPGFILSWLIG